MNGWRPIFPSLGRHTKQSVPILKRTLGRKNARRKKQCPNTIPPKSSLDGNATGMKTIRLKHQNRCRAKNFMLWICFPIQVVKDFTLVILKATRPPILSRVRLEWRAKPFCIRWGLMRLDCRPKNTRSSTTLPRVSSRKKTSTLLFAS